MLLTYHPFDQGYHLLQNCELFISLVATSSFGNLREPTRLLLEPTHNPTYRFGKVS
jgi:hypothetical protein